MTFQTTILTDNNNHDPTIIHQFLPLIGGGDNKIKQHSEYTFIGGGASNIVDGDYSTVLGGKDNSIVGDYSMVFGNDVDITQDYTTVFYNSDPAHRGRVGIDNENPTSTIHYEGSEASAIERYAGTLKESQHSILATGNITLPNVLATNCHGRIYYIKNVSGSAIKINVAGAGRIDMTPGNTNLPNNKAIIIQAEPAGPGATNDWWIMAKY